MTATIKDGEAVLNGRKGRLKMTVQPYEKNTWCSKKDIGDERNNGWTWRLVLAGINLEYELTRATVTKGPVPWHGRGRGLMPL